MCTRCCTFAKRGFTLAEALLAMGCLAVLIVALAALFTRLVAANNKSGDTEVGLTLAERLLEDAVARGTYDVDVPETHVQLQSQRADQLSDYTYRLDSEARPIVGSSGPSPYLLTADVWWWGPETQQRQGMGRLHVRLQRMVSP